MKTWINASLCIGCVALFSSTASFAETRFLRVTNSSSVSRPAPGIRPSLSADGTVLLYTIFSQEGGVYKQSVQMDKVAFQNTPSLIKGSHIEFPSGAPEGVEVWTSTAPSMNSTGSVVATAPVYGRDHVRIFKVTKNVPELIFEKSGEAIDSVNSVRVSRNGAFVAFATADYLEDGGVETTVWIYNVLSNSEKKAWSHTSHDYSATAVKGISDDGNKILMTQAFESETGGGNLKVLDVAIGAPSTLTDVKDITGGPCSSSWDGLGQYAAFAASAPLVKGDTNRALDVYLASTTAPNQLLRLSVAGGRQGNFSSGQPDISRNGLFTAFVSRADNLRASDTNYAKDVYVYSLSQGKLVSYVSGNDDIDSPTVNSNGRVVAFTSAASNFVPGDNNKEVDLFVGYPSVLP